MARKTKSPLPREVTKRRLARWQQERRRRRITIGIGALVIVATLAVIIWGVYATIIAPGKERVATVGDKHLTVVNYETMLRLSPNLQNSPEDALMALVNYEIVRQEAEELGIEATEDEIIQELRVSFTGEGEEELTDEELQRRYNETLNHLKVSSEQFKEAIATQVLALKIEEHVKGEVPDVGELIPHVHLQAIAVTTEEEAGNVTDRLESGEDFASLAAEYQGGDMGWVPQGLMSLKIEKFAFSPESGNVTKYFASAEGYSIIQVLETVEEREIEEEVREQLQDSAYGYWLEVQLEEKLKWRVDEEKLEQIHIEAMNRITEV